MIGTLGVIGQFERSIIRERTHTAIEALRRHRPRMQREPEPVRLATTPHDRGDRSTSSKKKQHSSSARDGDLTKRP